MKKIENNFAVTGFVGKDALCYVQHKASLPMKPVTANEFSIFFITIIFRSYTINFYNASRYCSHRAAPRIAVQYSFYSEHQKKKEDCADTSLVRMKCPVTALAVLHYSFALRKMM